MPLVEYQRALVELLREDAADLVESLGVADTLADFERRLEEPELHGAAGRLTAGILDKLGARDPLRVPAREFNLAAEGYYRDDLRRTQLRDALGELAADLAQLERSAPQELRQCLAALFPPAAGAPLERPLRGGGRRQRQRRDPADPDRPGALHRRRCRRAPARPSNKDHANDPEHRPSLHRAR